MRSARGLAFLLSLAAMSLSGAAPAAASVPNVRLTVDSASSSRPRCAIDNQANVVVVWQDARFGNQEILWQKFTQTGSALTPVVRVTSTAAVSARPDVSCDANGNSHITWQEGEDVNGVGTVYFCRLDASGVKVLSDVQVKDFSGDPRVSALPDGRTDIVWGHFSVVDQDVYYRRYGLTGVQSCERRFSAGSIPAISKTPVVCNYGTDFQMYWRDMTASFQLHIRHGAGNNACQSAAELAYGDALYPSVDILGNDLDLVLQKNNDIYAFVYGGNQDAFKVSLGSGTSSRPSLGAVGDGGYVAWQDSRDGNSEIYLLHYRRSTRSNITGDTRLTQQAAASEAPDLSVTKDGSERWVVVWQDSRDGNSEIYFTSRTLADTGSIAGHVTDLVDALPIPQATVQVLQGSAVVTEQTTDPEGAYLVTLLPAGTYDLSVAKAGYTSQTISPINVTNGNTSTIDVQLDPHTLGSVSTEYWPQHPTETPRTAPWRWGTVELIRNGLPQVSTITDAQGHFDLHFAALAGDVLRFSAVGPYVVLTDHLLQDQVPAMLVPLVPGQATNYTWPTSGGANAFYHANSCLRDFWADRFSIEFASTPVNAARQLPGQVYLRVDGPRCDGGQRACSDTDTVTLPENISGFSDAIYHELAHVLDRCLCPNHIPVGCQVVPPHQLVDDRCQAIQEGIADYFAATLNNDPNIVDDFELGARMRGTNVARRAPGSQCPYVYPGYKGGEILSSALWTLRGSLDGFGDNDARTTDGLVIQTVRAIHESDPPHSAAIDFDSFWSALRQQGPSYVSQIDAAFSAHNIPSSLDPDHCPGQILTHIASRGRTYARLVWPLVPGINEWWVWRRLEPPADATRSASGIADFDLIARGVHDSTFVSIDLTPGSSYTFVVSPSDSQAAFPIIVAPATSTVPTDTDQLDTPLRLQLSARTNPTVGRASMVLTAPNPMDAHVRIYDLAGHLVRELPVIHAVRGSNDLTWDGLDRSGRRVAGGLYLVRLKAERTVITTKIIVTH